MNLAIHLAKNQTRLLICLIQVILEKKQAKEQKQKEEQAKAETEVEVVVPDTKEEK